MLFVSWALRSIDLRSRPVRATQRLPPADAVEGRPTRLHLATAYGNQAGCHDTLYLSWALLRTRTNNPRHKNRVGATRPVGAAGRFLCRFLCRFLLTSSSTYSKMHWCS